MTETFTPFHHLSKFQQGDHPGAHKLNGNWTKIETDMMGQAAAFPATYPATKLLLRTDEGIIYKNTGSFETPAWTIILAADEADLTGLEGATGDEVIISMHVEGDTQEEFTISADGTLSWGSGSAAADINLERIGGGILGQRGSIPQIFRVYGNATDYLELAHTGTTGTISTSAGSGSLALGAAGSFRWTIQATGGHLVTNGNNSIDIGAAGAMPRSVYVGTHVVISGSSSGASLVVPSATAMRSGSVGGSYFFDLGNVSFRNGDGSSSGAAITLYGTFNLNGEVTLASGGANILEQKNGVNAQTFRVYGTTTGPKYLSLSHNGTNAFIDTASSAEAIFIGGVSTLVVSNGDNVVDLGSGAGRWKSVFFGTQIFAPNGTAGAPAYAFAAAGGDDGMYSEGAGDISFAISGARSVAIQSGAIYVLSNSGTLTFGATPDVIMVRDAANVLALKNGTNAQKFRVYGNASTTDYVEFGHDGTNTNWNVVGGGLISIQFGGLTYFQFENAGAFIPATDNGQDNGLTGTRWRSIYAGTALILGTTPSATGAIRLANNAAISARDVSDTGDGVLIKMDTSNIVRVSEAAGVYVSIMHHASGRVGFFANTPIVRPTYGAPSGGGPTRTTFDTTTVTLPQLAERVRAIIDDFRLYGLFA
jgi:hypothetical protein